MLSITPFGSLTVHIAYVVIGVMAAFNISSLPLYDSQVEDEDNLLSTLSITGVRSLKKTIVRIVKVFFIK